MPLAVALLAVACSHPEGTDAEDSLPPGSHAFVGTWSATGTRHAIDIGSGQNASVFDMTGSVMLTGEHRPAAGFQARVLGYADDVSGMQGRSVWIDERGDRLYSAITGEEVQAGKRITGKFVGGTGRYAGMTGDYTFTWKYLVDSDDGSVSGRADDLEGQASFAAPRRMD